MNFRVSSTPIGQYLDCPRMWAYFEIKGKELDSEPIWFGTLFHAVMEAIFVHCYNETPAGQEVVAEWIRGLPEGDYGGAAHLLDNEALWDWVWEVAADLFDVPYFQYLLSIPMERRHVEEDITPYGITLGNEEIPARGRIDFRYLDEDGTTVISDWKTRGSLSYAPFTDAEWRKHPQPAYYAAMYNREHPQDSGVRVEHLNVLRDGSGLARYGSFFEKSYLEKMARYFDGVLVPAMEDTYVEAQRMMELTEADRTACYKYGPCSFINECSVQKETEDEPFIDTLHRATKVRILSDEAPDEVQPVKVPDKPVTVLDGVTEFRASKLQGAGLHTLGQVKEFIEDGGKLQEINQIGSKTEARLVSSLEDFYEEYVG